MKGARLFADGQELQLDKSVGKGGEGEVFAISNLPGFAVKAYKPELAADREAKIRAMIASRLADNAPMVAFPQSIVVHKGGAFAGFVMRLVEKHKEIHELQTPSSRQKHFPKADYAFIVRVALNIARVFAQVHANGCVIGDINQKGILVSGSATITLIDADSFQVADGTKRYLCTVGVPEYTPPELQGKSLKSSIRTTDHDAFGLAVCLFQLLCMDRHPFSGRYTGKEDMPLEKAIAEYRFAYSTRNTGMVPPPGTVRLGDLTPRVAQLFEQAFSPNHMGKRPSAKIWIEALGELESLLRVCDRNKLHKYVRSAGECPWCRMEAQYGIPLFVDSDVSIAHIANARLDPTIGLVIDIPALLAMVNGVRVPDSISVPIPQIQTLPKPSQGAQEAFSDKQVGGLRKVLGLGALVGAVVAYANGFPGIVALGIAGFGVWLFAKSSSQTDGLLSVYRERVSAVAARVEYLQRNAPIAAVLQKKAEALALIDEFRKLGAGFGEIRNIYDKHRRQKQLDDHLSQFPIRGARIPKVSSSDLAQLASFGFTTAFDAKRRNVQQVYGIGPVKASNIAAWVSRIEARFQFRSAYTPEDQRNIQKVQSEVITKQQGLEERIKKAIDDLRRNAQAFERWQALRDPELLDLVGQLAQAEADLRHAEVEVPPGPSIQPTPVQQVAALQQALSGGGASTSPTSASSQSTRCPQCGAPMIRRVARRGSRAGKAFWGCSRYPSCTGTRPI